MGLSAWISACEVTMLIILRRTLADFYLCCHLCELKPN
ncbi:hypothetical protein yfred0001_3550 [Yersinia frederiksenii ATCC 33641]|nr:hypothetical protein yfred0001_3550 [Yersinia frederiksenii ATCC 33641]